MATKLSPKLGSSAPLRAGPAAAPNPISGALPAVRGAPRKLPPEESSGAYPAVRTPTAHDWPAVKKNYGGLPSGDALPAVKVPPVAPESIATEPLPRQAPRSRGIVALGILVLLLGAVLIVKQAAVADGGSDSSTNERSVTNGAPGSQTGSMKTSPGAQAFPAAMALAPMIAHKTRPAEFLDTLELNGKKPQFEPVASLHFQRWPLQVHCLLRARLDEETQQRWKNAGMLADDVLPTSFLLAVCIENEEALHNLYDWHVEGVCVGP